jgi:hypothetical protein
MEVDMCTHQWSRSSDSGYWRGGDDVVKPLQRVEIPEARRLALAQPYLDQYRPDG